MTPPVASLSDDLAAAIEGSVDRARLVASAKALVDVSSPTGHEEAIAHEVATRCEALGLRTVLQEVEPGRPNVFGILAGKGAGRSLMFNGHMDTSYSGDEPHLRDRPGFRPAAFERDGRLWGLGIANMKGAIACYLEALAALRDAGVTLRGTVAVAAVVGEIEKSQWAPEFVGADYRGYSAGSHYLVSHGGGALDVCVLGEPTENRVVTGHYGTLWGRISTKGPHVHTAFSRHLRPENSILRMKEVLSYVERWIGAFEQETAYGGEPGVVNVAAVRGGWPWRLSRTPERTDLFLDVRVPPTMTLQEACRRFDELVAELRTELADAGIDSEIFVTSPGAEIQPDHDLVRAIETAHAQVFGAAPEHDTVRWSSDASVLTRYGIATVNYGASSGLPHPDGENLSIDEMVRTATVYALTAAQICEVEQ
ncbi:MAG: M20/M25/M40 family metallo-hydrolase [Actinomycetota bacterium]|jgi:acetylornithine deacetylase|nr:M20/M25/M40 family metallo-hydrolase [Actinomycetota bacterium]